MLASFVVVLRSLALICCGHRAVALENLALRRQLAVFKRTVKRPPLRHKDHFHRHRPHRALSLAPPEPRAPAPVLACGDIRVLRRDRLGGVVHEYELAA